MTIPPIAHAIGTLAGLGLIGLAVTGLIAGGQRGSTFAGLACLGLGVWITSVCAVGLSRALRRPRYRRDYGDRLGRR